MPKIYLTEENIGKRVIATDIEGVIEKCESGQIEFIGRGPTGTIIEARPKFLQAVNNDEIPLCKKQIHFLIVIQNLPKIQILLYRDYIKYTMKF